MSLSCVSVDNLDGTATVTIAGADPATTVNLFKAPLSDGFWPLVWTAAGSRTGNGTVAFGPYGYWWLYAAGTVSSLAALSPPIVVLASRAALGVQETAEATIAAKIQSLCPLRGLSTPPGDLPADAVHRFPALSDDIFPLLTTLPCVLVTPAPAPEGQRPTVNNKDDIGYPVNVTLLDRFAPHETPPPGGLSRPATLTLWRQQIARAIRWQRLPGLPDMYTVEPEPQPILAWKPPAMDYCFSAITFRVWTREPRGV